jgi:hypothetical protein
MTNEDLVYQSQPYISLENSTQLVKQDAIEQYVDDLRSWSKSLKQLLRFFNDPPLDSIGENQRS